MLLPPQLPETLTPKLVALLGDQAGEVIRGPRETQPAGQGLLHGAGHLVTVDGIDNLLGAVGLLVHGRVLAYCGGLDVARRSSFAQVAVLAAEALSRLRVIAVIERGVLAAVDRPEERVVQCLSPDRRRAVDWQEEAGRAVLLVDRVIHRRQVENRDVLHLQDHVGEHRALLERAEELLALSDRLRM